jgi:HEAT repeat protein
LNRRVHRKWKYLTQILKGLYSKKPVERQQAQQALRSLKPEEIEALIALLNHDERLTGYRIGVRLGIGFPIYVGLLFVFVFSLARFAVPLPVVLVLLGTVTLLGFRFLLHWVFRSSLYTRRQRQVLLGLAELNDLRGVGPLLEALTFPDTQVRTSAAKALVSLLPQLPCLEGSQLNPELRPNLHAALTSTERAQDTPLLLALLRLVEKVGTEADMGMVEYLAHMAKTEEARQAAQACLPLMRARIEQTRNEQTLLRATTSPEVVAGELLRPASGLEETSPQQLLRSHTADP